MIETSFEYPRLVQKRMGDRLFDFWICDDVARRWYGGENALNIEYRWMLDRLKPGDTVIDVGGHHGMTACLFGFAVGSSGQVIAYDPVPENAAVIARNAAANELGWIQVRPVAVADAFTTRSAGLNKGNAMTGPSVRGGLTMNCVTLDGDLPPGLVPNMIKFDCEGGDLAALEGARRTLEHRPYVNMECHVELFDEPRATLEAIFSILDHESWRYTCLGRFSEPMWEVDGPMNIERLMELHNVHVFCEPR